MNKIIAAIKFVLSVFAIPFVMAYKAVKAGILHLFREVDKLFNICEKDDFMGIRDDINAANAKLDALATAVAAIGLPDLTALAKETTLIAVGADVTAIKDEILK